MDKNFKYSIKKETHNVFWVTKYTYLGSVELYPLNLNQTSFSCICKITCQYHCNCSFFNKGGSYSCLDVKIMNVSRFYWWHYCKWNDTFMLNVFFKIVLYIQITLSEMTHQLISLFISYIFSFGSLFIYIRKR